MKYYAHTKEGVGPAGWQELDAHLSEVANLAARFTDSFGAKEWGRIAGLLHDIGKTG